MARLLKKSGLGEPEVLELNLGVNHFGRNPENHFPIDHPTVSSLHCDITLTADGVLLHDHDSTNGTFIDGQPVQQGVLLPGQTVRLGDVELFVETTDVHIAIPEIERAIPTPPVVLPDGAMLCPRHPTATVTHRCTHCHAVLCDECVTRLRRRGGQTLKLCALCSHAVELIAAEKPKKKGFLAKLTATIKLPFLRGRKGN
ncbi:MAG: FHA domain-containing protein [Verrucomicrobiota bacterium]